MRRGPSELKVSTTLRRVERLRERADRRRGRDAEGERLGRGVAVGLPGRRNRQHPAVGVQVQEAWRRAVLLDDHDALTRRAGCCQLLVRILRAVLNVGRARRPPRCRRRSAETDRNRWPIRRADRTRTDWSGAGRGRHDQVLKSGCRSGEGCPTSATEPGRRAAVDEVTLPGAGRAVVQMAGVPRRRKIQRAAAVTSLTAWITTPPLVFETTLAAWPS